MSLSRFVSIALLPIMFMAVIIDYIYTNLFVRAERISLKLSWKRFWWCVKTDWIKKEIPLELFQED